ncbi:hypothetical protein ACQ4M3_13460 [Leptolyngbya sp. AN03gr2]|uniref:hypothetical protein n=1 Tax=unclassified Leptolyngbya TaxID=2650499 RepID=UPI003D311309
MHTLLKKFDDFLRQSPFGYRVQGVGRELNHFGVKPDLSERWFPELGNYSLTQQDSISLDVLRAIGDRIQVLEAGRALYQLIEVVFRDRPPVPSLVDGLMTHAFSSNAEVAYFNNKHLVHEIGEIVLWIGLNGLPFRVTGMFEETAINLEITRTQRNLYEERWGELHQVPYHGARAVPAEQPSDAFKLRLVHHIWNLCAQAGFVNRRSQYSPPPWLKDPIYTAPPKETIFKRLLKQVSVEYRTQREIIHQEEGKYFHNACTAAQFRALYPNYKEVKAEEPSPPIPVSVESVSKVLTELNYRSDASLEQLTTIWQFNNQHRHSSEHHLWRLHTAEIESAKFFLKARS